MKRSTMRLSRRTSIIAGVTAFGLIIGGGVAFAYWTTTGSGSASAAVANSAGLLTVNQTVGATITGLYPGGPGQDVDVTVDNPTSTDIQLSDVAVTVTGTQTAGGAPNPGCTSADFAVADVAAYTGELILAGQSTGSIVPKTIRMVETGVNQDACKGAVVLLSLAAS